MQRISVLAKFQIIATTQFLQEELIKPAVLIISREDIEFGKALRMVIT